MKYAIPTIVLLVCSVVVAAQSTANRVEPGAAPRAYMYVEQSPKFREKLDDYIKRNLHYPPSMPEVKREGESNVQFIVNVDGSISDVSIKHSPGSTAFDLEAIRLVKDMPVWNPGKTNGKIVSCYQQMIVPFMLLK